jgi:hypothetical protein
VHPLGAEAAAEDDRRPIAPRPDVDVGQALVGHDQTAVAGADRTAVLRHDSPAVELLVGQAVRDPQRLDRRGERDHREIRHQDEADALGKLGRSCAEHGYCC